MNNYEESYEKIRLSINSNLWDENLDYAFYLFEQLVKRATPMKPILSQKDWYDDKSIGECVCGWFNTNLVTIDAISYCPKCGQALDWSDK